MRGYFKMRGYFIILIFGKVLALPQDVETYLEKRREIISFEESLGLGSTLELDSTEKVVNAALMEAKLKEFDESFNGTTFPPSQYFPKIKQKYEESEVYKFIQKLPKGGALHLHDISIASIDWVVINATYRENLYVCREKDQVEFRFLLTPTPSCNWIKVSDLRSEYGNKSIDSWIRGYLLMDQENSYSSVNSAWAAFTKALITVIGIVTYKPVFTDYFMEALKEFDADGVQYLELRTTLPPLYQLQGPDLGPADVVSTYLTTWEEFHASHPWWCDIKLIYAPIRDVTNTTVDTYLSLAVDLAKQFPGFMAGFDLVGQEDPGKPLVDFIPALLQAGKHLKFFFHAGETDWFGSSTDLNLLDAILLNTTRIGHGYALLKHPVLLDLARKRNIPLEICPISNQVLGLVDDLRNHPAAILSSTNYPLVISSDDPAVWDANPLSSDFYAAFMALGGRSSDLRFLKQFVLNSVDYSAMSSQEKAECTIKVVDKWNEVIKKEEVEIHLRQPREENILFHKQIFGWLSDKMRM